MKISRVSLITSVALLFLAACGGSESSIQSSTSSVDSSPQVTLPPKGAFSGDATGGQPCWWDGPCFLRDVGPGGGIVFAVRQPQEWGEYIEVSKQTLAPDKLCDSAAPRTDFFVWPDYDGIGNSVTATGDLYSVCKNGLAGKAYAHSQTSPIYSAEEGRVKWHYAYPLPEDRNKYNPVSENCCKDWRLPTLKEAQEIYRLRPAAGEKICLGVGEFESKVCEDFVIEVEWYYTATPNPDKCEYWAINMADGQIKSVKPNEQLRGLMVRNFGDKVAKNDSPPRVPIPERSVLEKYTLASLQKLYDQLIMSSSSKPTTTGGIIDRLLKHPNAAVKKVSCVAPTSTTTVAPTTTTTVAPTTTVKTVAPTTTVKKVVPKK